MDVFSEDGVTHSDLQFFGVAVGAILVIVVNLQVSALVFTCALAQERGPTCPRTYMPHSQTHTGALQTDTRTHAHI